jgi:hypothetical protein
MMKDHANRSLALKHSPPSQGRSRWSTGSTRRERSLIRHEHHAGRNMLLAGTGLGLVIWVVPAVSWLFSPPEPNTDY